jgi:hypothetical protein
MMVICPWGSANRGDRSAIEVEATPGSHGVNCEEAPAAMGWLRQSPMCLTSRWTNPHCIYIVSYACARQME